MIFVDENPWDIEISSDIDEKNNSKLRESYIKGYRDGIKKGYVSQYIYHYKKEYASCEKIYSKDKTLKPKVRLDIEEEYIRYKFF